MLTTPDAGLLLIAGSAIAGLIVLVSWLKVPPFIALILTSFGVGLAAGENPSKIATSFSQGIGSVLGSVAVILALGAFLGKGLEVSGGAAKISRAFVTAFPKTWTVCAIVCAAFVVGIPVFFNAGLVLLIPVAATIARQRGLPLASLGLPMVTGLSVAHGLVPPHPGPISAIGILHADVGRTIAYSLMVGFPTAFIIGVWIAPRLPQAQISKPSSSLDRENQLQASGPRTGIGFALATIFAPVLLMLLAVVADFLLPESSTLRVIVDGFGNPMVAMLIGAFVSFVSLMRHQNFDKNQLARLAEESLVPLGGVLLVVGAGGGFSRVLLDCGIGTALARQAASLNISPLLLAWLVAAFVRVAAGSATVAITTGAGLLAPIIAANQSVNRELVVLALGAGSLILSHVNDGGFWLVKEYLQLSVTETLKTWTILESAISILAFALVLGLNLLS